VPVKSPPAPIAVPNSTGLMNAGSYPPSRMAASTNSRVPAAGEATATRPTRWGARSRTI
jgi:hypothetical protein